MILVLLLGCAVAATNYTNWNDTFSWGALDVHNYGQFAFNAPPSLPYQVIENVAQNQMRGYFDYPTNYGAQTVGSMTPVNIRVDSGQANNVNIGFAMYGAPVWHEVRYNMFMKRYYAGNQTSQGINVVVIVASNNGWQCGTPWSTIDVAGVVWRVATFSWGYCLTLPSPPTSFSGVLETADLLSALATTGRLSQYDVQREHLLAVWFGGAGNYELNTSDVTPPIIQSTRPGEKLIGNYTFDNWQYLPSLYSADYLNVTYQNGAQGLNDIVIDFLYTRDTLNAYPRVYFGYLNGKWYTPNVGYNFPIAANTTTVSLQVSVAYTQIDTTASKKAACIGLTLRKDYNPSNQTYSTLSINPSIEVQVCTWWSPLLTKNGSLGSVIINEIVYTLCSQSASSADNLTHWLVYNFISETNFLDISSYDAWPFIQYVNSQIFNLTGYYVTGVYFGFQIYTGKGNFIITRNPQIVQSTTTVVSDQFFFNFLYNFIISTLSSPSGIILLQLSPLVVILDDLSYYSYHNGKYDYGFKLLTDYCWNINNNRWVPPFLDDTYQKINSILNYLQLNDWANRTPIRFILKKQTIYFLNNAQDFLFSSVPLNLSSFILLWYLRKKLKCNSITRLLRPFSCFSYLFIALFCDNIQYLSFRCFQQLRFIVPSSKLQIVSIVMSLITLYLTLLSAISVYSLIRTFNKQFCLDNMKRCRLSQVSATATLFLRVLAGFVHAFIDSSYPQTIMLLVINITALIVTCSFYRSFEVKRNLVCLVCIMLFKAIVNAMLVIQLRFSFEPSLINPIQSIFVGFSTVLLYSIAILLILQYLMTTFFGFLIGFLQLIKCCKQKAKHDKPQKETERIKKTKQNQLHRQQQPSIAHKLKFSKFADLKLVRRPVEDDLEVIKVP